MASRINSFYSKLCVRHFPIKLLCYQAFESDHKFAMSAETSLNEVNYHFY